MGLVQTKNIMQELKLHGMYEQLENILDKKGGESDTGLVESLDHLLQAEKEYRKEKSTERMMRQSKLIHKPQLEDFDFTAKRTFTKSQVKDLYELGWVKSGRSIIIVGPTGVGKTFLSQALGTHCCTNGQSTLFLGVTQYLEELVLARSTNSYLKYLNRLGRPQVLVIDDFGLRKLSVDEGNDFCDLLKLRAGKSTIITTQLPVKNWQEVLEDPVTADAIIDRVVHTSLLIDLKGESYRKVQGKKLDRKTSKK